MLRTAVAVAGLGVLGSWLGLGCSSSELSQVPAAGGAGAPAGEGGAAAATGEAGAAGATARPAELVFDHVHISSDGEAENVQRAFADADFGDEPVARATLRVELESPCFPFEKWQESEIPAGHNWPALCDAFDRLLLISIDDPEPGTSAPPGLELARAVTPFGGPLSYEADVTDIVNALPGPHRFRVDIGTYGDPDGIVSGARGEWIVTVALSREPGVPARVPSAVVPLWFDWIDSSEPRTMTFEVPEGASSARIEYRTTGHGGVTDPKCLGPAEEFCKRTHTFALDGVRFENTIPWRSDCANGCTPAHFDSGTQSRDYCAENPCGDPGSVRASRANWCPGSVTPPALLAPSALAVAGSHELELRIDPVHEGGSWLASLTLFAYDD